MKRPFLFLILLSAGFLPGFAAQLTVNNSTNLPVNPGVYTDLPAAVSNAATGDTILVAGSLNTYSATTINKKLIIVGAGFNPDQQNPLPAFVTSITLNSSLASGSSIMGIKTDEITFAQNTPFSNVLITRCYVFGGILMYDSMSNVTISQNIINSEGDWGIYLGALVGTSNLKIVNNIFLDHSYILYANSALPTHFPAVTIDHNLFLDGSYSTPYVSSNFNEALENVGNAIISNNIFYNISPQIYVQQNSCPACGLNNTFNNNITYAGGALPTLPLANNIGAGNINNTDPQFTAIFTSATNPYLDFNQDNLRPKSTSPVINAATDGSDIGPAGGTDPVYTSTNRYLTGEPTVPEVKLVNYISNSAVPAGTNLTIQVTAKKIN
jgi:hypothetical protein